MYNFYFWAYSIFSACVTIYTWVALFWALDEENLQSRRIFRYKPGACLLISTTVWYSVGFIMLAYILFVDHDEKDYENVVRKNV